MKNYLYGFLLGIGVLVALSGCNDWIDHNDARRVLSSVGYENATIDEKYDWYIQRRGCPDGAVKAFSFHGGYINETNYHDYIDGLVCFWSDGRSVVIPTVDEAIVQVEKRKQKTALIKYNNLKKALSEPFIILDDGITFTFTSTSTSTGFLDLDHGGYIDNGTSSSTSIYLGDSVKTNVDAGVDVSINKN
jgi:hypothetical protein